MLAFGYDGLLTRTEYAIQGRWDDPWPAGALAGTSVSVRTSPRDREALVTSPDGVIDQLVLRDDDEIVQERVGTVVLPEGHCLAGAARVGGFGPIQASERLIVATTDHAPINDYPVSDPRLFEGRTWLWSTTVQEPDARPVDPPGISAQAAGRDLVVCWPGGGAVSREGWTLGGVPAAAVVPIHDQCALIVRDLDAAMPTPQLGAWAATGTVPGVGPVQIGITADPAERRQAWDLGWLGEDWSGHGTRHAPLPDGGFTTVASENAPGGVLWGQAGAGYRGGVGTEIGTEALRVVALGGHGFWELTEPPRDGSPNLFLQGEPRGWFDASSITALTEAGGVWVTERDGTCTVVEVDGSTRACPTDQLDEGLIPRLERLDGTVCGSTAEAPACQLPGEALQRASGFTDGSGAMGRWTPLGGDTYLIGGERGSQAIDVGTMRRAWGAEGRGRMNADGTVWMVGDGRLHALRPSGPEAIELPDRIADYTVVDVLPAGEVLVLVFEGWPAGRFPATVGQDWREDDVGYARIPTP